MNAHQPSEAPTPIPDRTAGRSSRAPAAAEQLQRADWLQRLCAYTGTLGLGIGTVSCFFFGHLVWAFTCNTYHSAWTLLLTVVGIVAIRRGEAASFNLMSGVFLTMAGLTYFPAGLRELQRTYMNTNWAMTGIHFL